MLPLIAYPTYRIPKQAISRCGEADDAGRNGAGVKAEATANVLSVAMRNLKVCEKLKMSLIVH
jgi:hypothetical protein